MNKEQLIEALSTRQAGGVAWIHYKGTPSKLRAAAKREKRIVKVSKIPLQLASYGNRQAVREAVEAGERLPPELPDWLVFEEYVKGSSGAYFARHKGNGTLYFCAPRMDVKAGDAVYLMDGKPVPFDSIREHFQPSAFTSRPTKAEANDKGQDLFNRVSLDNIESVS